MFTFKQRNQVIMNNQLRSAAEMTKLQNTAVIRTFQTQKNRKRFDDMLEKEYERWMAEQQYEAMASS